MAKFWAKQNGASVDLGGVSTGENIPDGAIEITRAQFDAGKRIGTPLFRKIENGIVVEKTEQEKNEALNSKIELFRGAVLHKISRRSYRLTRQPFDYSSTKIKLENTDLRQSPQTTPHMTWDNFIRDAVMCELTGNSILPIKLPRPNETSLQINTAQELYAAHKAMVLSNKATLESELALRLQLKNATDYESVKQVRLLNRDRTKG